MNPQPEMSSRLVSWKMYNSKFPKGPPAKPILYYSLESPPCLTVIAVARFLELDLDLQGIDLISEEQKRKEFVKINPFKCVPAFIDTDSFTLSESRAIAMYLIASRSANSSLYPSQDAKGRALIDRWLQFDLGTLCPSISDVISTVWINGDINRSKKPRLEEVLQIFDASLSLNITPFLAGPLLTLADISLYFTWRHLEAFQEIDTSVYLAIAGWSRKVNGELKPVNGDGLFDKAWASMLDFTRQMRQGIVDFD